MPENHLSEYLSAAAAALTARTITRIEGNISNNDFSYITKNFFSRVSVRRKSNFTHKSTRATLHSKLEKSLIEDLEYFLNMLLYASIHQQYTTLNFIERSLSKPKFSILQEHLELIQQEDDYYQFDSKIEENLRTYIKERLRSYRSDAIAKTIADRMYDEFGKNEAMYVAVLLSEHLPKTENYINPFFFAISSPTKEMRKHVISETDARKAIDRVVDTIYRKFGPPSDHTNETLSKFKSDLYDSFEKNLYTILKDGKG